MVLRAVEMFRGRPERPETAEVVGQVQVQARMEARDAEGVVVFSGALVGEDIGSVEGEVDMAGLLSRSSPDPGVAVPEGTAEGECFRGRCAA
ncbi:Uncharacterised protein [Rhodococcus gordoniae]|uniref:Uncharacterized protein n=1 Tax=Rhodococcus gordoniae TaxID=223392 RepID=A0A379LVR8_9NOCA|nr:hypothetical protein [Rhodococcus gordoniae]SUE13423.1 Uncharacterised protein [Rhodococcus gordoniae]